jgi:SNF2 family DNA or RNA helicase
MQELNLILNENGKLSVDYTKKTGREAENIKEFQDKFTELCDKSIETALFYLGFTEHKGTLSPTLNFWQEFSKIFIDKLRLTENLNTTREKTILDFDNEIFRKLLSDAPFFQGSEYLNIDVLKYYWDSLLKYFRKEIKKFKGSVEEFFHKYTKDINLADQVYFHLVENRKGSSSPFAFLATYSTSTSKDGKSQHKPLKNVLTEYSDNQNKLIELLSRVYKVADESTLICNLIKSGELFYPLSFNAGDAFDFLKESSIYEENGILCRIPNWWKGARKGIGISATLGRSKKSLVGLESLLDFKMKLTVAGEELTLEEAKQILAETDGLTLIKGKWVAIDKERLGKTLNKWEELQSYISDGFSFSEAMRIVSGVKELETEDSETDISVGFDDWITSVLRKMQNPKLIKEFSPANTFKAKLREYQENGLNWLGMLGSLKLGACLADDMGLGKTIQVIALINHLKSKRKFSASLLVVPASLIHNWISEFRKFSPNIKIATAHSSSKELYLGDNPDFNKVRQKDIIITTYGMVKSLEWLKKYKWNYLILDEAQAIKNPNTNQTKAVKVLKCSNKIALTGTPIENSLSDLWSLFDFLNPGLLGNKTEFKRLAKDADSGFGKIRKLITPYILRRLKTDKNVISDLPNKIEMDVFSSLSKKQATLYEDRVEFLSNALKDSKGIERKGLVISSLIKFKQICNHPSQYLGDSGYKNRDSGKFIRLKEICEAVKDKRERILIFTQFKEIIKPLNKYLEEVFVRKGLTLHGGTPIKKRKELVEKFQSDEYYPFFILSLKAGGTGLNLTQANHVVHFDRWWNPAVENQATDRAFRIGQKKSVVVHKFICEGTFEEKIDQMLKDKSKLSENILSDTKSSWITELGNDELIDMFTLGRTQ